jgi:hypothetical protein
MRDNGTLRVSELKRSVLIMQRFQDWKRWKLYYPLALLLLIYPLSKLKGFGHEFLGSFSHGDLLLFSSLVLIELSVEASHIHNELGRDPGGVAENLIQNSKFCGLLLIFCYGALKFFGEEASAVRMTAYCVFSLSVTILVVAYSVYAFWKTLESVVNEGR